VPNAQHAVRQGKRLAANIAATLHGELPRDYRHHSLGVVATLGLGRGIFQYKRLVITGPLAWLMHRGYHVLAIPTWERKIRVLAVWLTAFVLGRDIVSLLSVQDPRSAFVSGGLPTPDDRGDPRPWHPESRSFLDAVRTPPGPELLELREGGARVGSV
jgi:NADH dehydrogenase